MSYHTDRGSVRHDVDGEHRKKELKMIVSEDGVVELCKMGVIGVRKIVGPNTRRVAEAFDDLMSAVKVSEQCVHCKFKTCCAYIVHGTNEWNQRMEIQRMESNVPCSQENKKLFPFRLIYLQI